MSENTFEREPFILGHDWMSDLTSHPWRLRTPSVGQFEHAPLSKAWKHNFKVGLEFYIRKGTEAYFEGRKRLYWLAKAVQYKGYFVKLRYIRFRMDAANDFWLHLFSPRLKAKPGCMDSALAMEAIKRYVETHNWSNPTTPYKEGDIIEIVDRDNLSQIQLAEVKMIVGGRLFVYYIDGRAEPGFWVNQSSSLVHPQGWAKAVGHDIVAPPWYNPPKCDLSKYEMEVKGMILDMEGVKLEAVDPLKLSQICSATITKVLNAGFLMVRMDYHTDYTNCTDFCYHILSPCLRPSGFCELHGIHLRRTEEEESQEEEQINESKSIADPTPDKTTEVRHEFRVGMRIEAVDLISPWWIGPATITHVIGNLLRIKFDDWDTEYDQWMPTSSPDIYPIGYCEYTQYMLNQFVKTEPNAEVPVEENVSFDPTVSMQEGAIAAEPSTILPPPPITSRLNSSGSDESCSSSGYSSSSCSTNPKTNLQAAIAGPSSVVASPSSTTTSIQDMEQSRSRYRKRTQFWIDMYCGEDKPITCPKDCELMYEQLPYRVPAAPNIATGSYSAPTSPKIPIFIGTTPVSGSWEGVDPSIWGPEQVVTFLTINGYEAYSHTFLRNNISGSSLLQLTELSRLMNATGLETDIAESIVTLIKLLTALLTTGKVQESQTTAQNVGNAAGDTMELNEINNSLKFRRLNGS